MLTCAILLLAAAAELPPMPPRVTLTPLPGGALVTLAYDQRRIDLPAARAEEVRAALAAAKLDELLAAHLRLRTATTAAETAATRTAEETRTAQREKERLDRQQREVDALEKQADAAKANFNRWRNRDERQAAQHQANLQSLNARAANERKQLARAKENHAAPRPTRPRPRRPRKPRSKPGRRPRKPTRRPPRRPRPRSRSSRGWPGCPSPAEVRPYDKARACLRAGGP